VDNAITKAVFDEVEWLLKDCHPTVAANKRGDVDRYARLNASCAALESFSGMRPRADDDVFDLISKRRAEVADVLAAANLEARIIDLADGIYLAIPFFSRCSDKQPVWLVNKSGGEVVYIGRKLYAFASDDDGISDYRTQSSAFADGIAPLASLAPGSKIKIDDYSMSYDGDFVGVQRLVLLIGGEQIEMITSVGKLAGYLWKDKKVPGFHLLKPVQKGE
jgi:PHD/YefM family antitoxin component YafN of YafNO toxin-antitoxin module